MTVGLLDHSPPDSLPPLLSDRPVPRPLLWAAFGVVGFLYAILWTKYWYPLSDSSLYLVLARGLAQGRGYGFLKQVHRDVRPMTPYLLYFIIKGGGGIGAMHAAATALTLLSHVLAFLTVRRWFNERVALVAVLVMASSWWVFANAFTVMTEPLFLVMFWACLLTLEGVPRAAVAGQWARVIFGAIFLLGAFENRIAAVPLIPGTVFGLWMSNRKTPLGHRVGWMAVFGIIFLGAYVELTRPKILFGKPTTVPAALGGPIGVQKSDDEDAGGPDAYHLNALVNVTNPLVQLPVSAGRWITESLAAATEIPFGAKVPKAVQYAAGVSVFGIFLLTCAGWFRLLRERKWYAVGMAVYFFPLWIMWGNRLKPRYMTPILPLAFIQLWAGAAMLLWQMRGKGKAEGFERFTGLSRWVGGVLAVGVVALNVPPYAVDLYMRRQTKLNFYDIARRGAFAELVDIGGYLQKNASRDAGIWMNWGPNRRVLGFLSDRDFRILPPAKKRGSGNIQIDSPADRIALNTYFKSIVNLDPTAEWALVFYNKNPDGWPNYHLPLAKTGRTAASPAHWWQLFRREKRTEHFVPVTVPVDREYVRAIPGANDRISGGSK